MKHYPGYWRPRITIAVCAAIMLTLFILGLFVSVLR